MHALKLACLFAAVVVAATGCGSGDEEASSATTQTTTTETSTTSTETTTETEAAGPTMVRIVVVNAAPKGGIVRTTLQQGDKVVISVMSDTADEIHLHGYDLSRDIAAGGTARIAFTATLPGRFEVELENRGVQIADLTVQP
jgi:hypothetical protein